LAALGPSPCAAQAREPADTPTAQVEVVIDGDTLVLTDGRHVRLIGINAPELARTCGGAPARDPHCTPTREEPLAQAARRRLESLVANKPITLVTGEDRHDHYGRLLAHLQLADGSDPEEALLHLGLASVIAIPPNLERLARYQAIEAEARAVRRGLWGEAYFAPLPVEQLRPGQTGYRFIQGRVSRTGRSRQYVYLDLGPRMSIMVAHADWERYFSVRPESLRERNIEARGWITEYNGKLRLRLRHPAMWRTTQ
jgi:endonuclease YncB( thermonuclease family)